MPLYDVINIACAIICLTVAILFFSYKYRSRKTVVSKCTIREETECDLPVSAFIPEGQVVVYSLHQKDKKAIPYGYVLISGHEDTPSDAVLWFVYVREKHRRCGYGKKLIAFLQSRFDTITTQYEYALVNTPGVKLCLSCGFKLKGNFSDRQPPSLTWKRGGN